MICWGLCSNWQVVQRGSMCSRFAVVQRGHNGTPAHVQRDTCSRCQVSAGNLLGDSSSNGATQTRREVKVALRAGGRAKQRLDDEFSRLGKKSSSLDFDGV